MLINHCHHTIVVLMGTVIVTVVIHTVTDLTLESWFTDTVHMAPVLYAVGK